ncbi:MAG: hypothetical protein CM15mP83_5200 [Flavobacteriaceae bacterium]|nr:MAG: hypothetical protein CM15mP83_5200 [Flavobacteriaceae bacterium]
MELQYWDLDSGWSHFFIVYRIAIWSRAGSTKEFLCRRGGGSPHC